MAIYLSDPRQRALENAVSNYVGYRQRKNYQEREMNDFKTGLDTLNNVKQRRLSPSLENDDYNQAIAGQYGIPNIVGLDAKDAIGNFKANWETTQGQINDIDNQLSTAGLDENSKNSLLQQRSLLANQQKFYSGQADFLRGILGRKKGTDLTGLGKDDSGVVSTTQPNLFNFSVQTPTSKNNTGNQQNRDWLGLQSMISQSLSAPAQNSYLITADDLAQDDQIKKIAENYSKQRSLQNFNEADYMTDVIGELVKAKISPSAINSVLPYAQQHANQVSQEKAQNKASGLFNQLQNAQGRTEKAIIISQLNAAGYKVPDEILKHNFVMNHIDGGGNIFGYLYDKNTGQTEGFVIPKTIDPTDKYKTDMSYKTNVDTANIRGQYSLAGKAMSGGRGGGSGGRSSGGSGSGKYYETPSTNINDIDQANALLEAISNYPDADQIKRDLEQYEPFLEKALGTEAAHNHIAFILMEAERRGIPGSYVQRTATDGFLQNK